MLLFGALLLGAVGVAQTVNTGELSVMPNTMFSTVEDFNNTPTGSLVNDGEAFIYANFNNDGIVNFTPGQEGYTRFEGEAIQKLSGGKTSYFYDVLFNNPSSNTAAFELSSQISIANLAGFYKGIVKNDDFGGLVIFLKNATHTYTSNEGHVDGLVQKNGNTAFEYPIGDAQHFRYAAISAPDNVKDVFSGKYFFENPNTKYPLSSHSGVIQTIDNQEYWTVTRNSGTSNVMLTLSWDESTTPQQLLSQPSALHIVRWDENQKLWVDEGGVADPDNKTITTVIAPTDYGVFTLATVKEDLLLPDDVVVYNGVTPNGDGLNDYFIIKGAKNLANNNVQIFNRWGAKVFETDSYDTNGNVFKGYSDGKLTVEKSSQLPTGTYFYILTYDFNGQRIKKAGYLYLTTGK